MWKAIKSHCLDNSTLSTTSHIQVINNTVIEHGEDPSHKLALITKAYENHNAGKPDIEKLPETMLKNALIQSLRPSLYNSLRPQLNTYSVERIVYVCHELYQKDKNDMNVTAIALAVQKTKFKHRNKNSFPKMNKTYQKNNCSFCKDFPKRRTHTNEECRFNPKSKAYVKCTYCHKSGHSTNFCSLKKKKEGKRKEVNMATRSEGQFISI